VTSAVVKRLGSDDAAALRALRIEALTLHPACFCADLDLERELTLEQWEERLRRAAWFGAKKDDTLIGMVAFTRPVSKKIGHTGELASMYVRAGERGTGVATALLKAVIDHAAEGVEQLKLTVNADNTGAIRFYERHGFRTVGRIPNYIRIGEAVHDELTMVRSISSSD
jgi:ribosomal protein S18 acetylase RimI-like enzyme